MIAFNDRCTDFQGHLNLLSVSWSKDTSFNHMFIYNYMFIMQRNTDWRFSEAIHLLKCVGFIVKLFFFLAYISSLYTQTVFSLDLPGLVTDLQTVKFMLNKRNKILKSKINIPVSYTKSLCMIRSRDVRITSQTLYSLGYGISYMFQSIKSFW